MKRLLSVFSLLLLIVVLTVKCKKDKVVEVVQEVEEPKPMVAFDYALPDVTKFLEVQFTATPQNYKALLWQFGDDSTSVQVSPKHVYRFPGKYHVVLTVRNGQGYTAVKEIDIRVVDPTINYSIAGENYIQTIGGTFSVNLEAGGGPNSDEGSSKLVDGNTKTKFLQAGFDGTQRCTFELKTPEIVGAYTLTSGNDAADRDPKFWILQGSEDGIQYRDLHTVTTCPWENTDTGPSRNQTKLFHFDNYIAYKYYRLYIKQTRSSRVFQLSEWTINKKQP